MSEQGKALASTFNGKLRIEWQNNRIIFVDEDGKTRLLIGPRLDGELAVELSAIGHDVLTASDIDLIMSSRFKGFTIVATDLISAPAVTTVADGTNTFSGGQTTSTAHGLGYAPLPIAFVEVSPNQYTLMPYSETVSASSPSGGIISQTYRITTDATNIKVFHYVVSYSPGVGAGTYSGANIRYFLLRQTAALV